MIVEANATGNQTNDNKQGQKIVYTVPEVAAMLQVSKYLVYEEIRQGKLGHIKVGKNIRISQHHINSYLNKTGADVKVKG